MNLEGSVVLYKFSKIIVTDSPLKPKTSPAIGLGQIFHTRNAFPPVEQALFPNKKCFVICVAFMLLVIRSSCLVRIVMTVVYSIHMCMKLFSHSILHNTFEYHES